MQRRRREGVDKKRPQMQKGAKKKNHSHVCQYGSTSIRTTHTHCTHLQHGQLSPNKSTLCKRCCNILENDKLAHCFRYGDTVFSNKKNLLGISVLRTQIEGHKVLNGTRKSEHYPQGLTFRVSCVWLVIYIAGFAIWRYIFSA